MGQASRTELAEAYLLHRRNYRETSMLLDFFTRSHGRLTLLGKGTRRQKSHHAAVLWPFVPLAVSWSGRSDLPVMINAERTGPAGLHDPRRLACALYLNELTVHLLAPGDPHPRLFDLYRTTIHELVADPEPATVLRFFELSFLEEIGYALALERDIETGEPIRSDRFYEYRVEHGPVESEAAVGCIRGSTLLALRHRNLDTALAMREAKGLMRRVIAHHLGGRRLRSRELLKYSPHV
jgi:DNA repair protein RecO (recombination protein O)